MTSHFTLVSPKAPRRQQIKQRTQSAEGPNCLETSARRERGFGQTSRAQYRTGTFFRIGELVRDAEAEAGELLSVDAGRQSSGLTPQAKPVH